MQESYLLLLQHLRTLTGGIFDKSILYITQLGEPVLTFLLLGFIYWCVDKNAGSFMAVNVGVSSTYSQVFKRVFKVERPWIVDSRIQPVQEALGKATGYSFPSGHTTRGAAIWGALGTYLIRNKEKLIGRICWVIALLIGFSRNYLGVHTIWDVLAALAMCLAVMYITAKAVKWCDGGKNRDIVIAFIGCVVCFLPMLRFGCLSNAGAGMGAWIGWAIERHFIKFEPCKTTQKRFACFSLGALGIVYIQTVLIDTLMLMIPSKYASFWGSFVLLMFIMVVYPFFFMQKKRYWGGVVCLVLVLAANVLTVIRYSEPKNTVEEVEVVDAVVEEVQQKLPIIIAHRGYSSVYPENTLLSIAGAIDIEADMVEFDVQMTSDGVIVAYHDTHLTKLGLEGSVADYTYEEVCRMDIGSNYSAEFTGVGMPTLAEIMELAKDSDIAIYLELKDIGDVVGFEEAVLAVTDSCDMTSRCVFASFNEKYLQHLKEINPLIQTLYNVTNYDSALPRQVVADYYGLNYKNISKEVVDAIHSAGKMAYVWTVDAPKDMMRMAELGVDGICTNKPGLARVAIQPEYSFISQYYTNAHSLPGLYGVGIPDICDDVVTQGMTYAEKYWLVSAYSKKGENSILYVLDNNGKWITTVDMGYVAHVGGLAYDEANALLWATSSGGCVCAFDWNDLKENIAQGTKSVVVPAPEVIYTFDAELTNHEGNKVASFMDIRGKKMYIGSYTKGCNGVLRVFDISNPKLPSLFLEQEIPERIQGMTFAISQGKQYLVLTQGGHPDDSKLLVFPYSESVLLYEETVFSVTLPEGVEQLEMNGKVLTLLFESASRPYYETSRIRNDQIWRLDLSKMIWE